MINGFYLLLKPPGFTSSDAVVKLRGILSCAYGTRIKCGHLGTLDPGGSGILPIAVGSATALFDVLRSSAKTYIAEAVFGLSTDTLDSYGKPLEKCDWYDKTENLPDGFFSDQAQKICSLFPTLIGKQMQLPPDYSSKSINGKRAYDLARQGKSFTLNAAAIEIYSLDVLSVNKNRISFRLCCSGGTYVRSLVRDLGLLLGLPAYMSYIIRTEACGFSINDAVTFEQLQQDSTVGFVSMKQYAQGLLRIDLTPETSKLFGVGTPIPSQYSNGLCAFYSDSAFLGIGQITDGFARRVCLQDDVACIPELFRRDLFPQKVSMALGYFDSVHLGHRKLLCDTKRTNGMPSLFTFSSPLGEILINKAGKDLFSFKDRCATFEAMGIKHVFYQKPTVEFLSLSALDFLNYLCEYINIGTFVCGEDYRFGKNGEGDANTLQAYCATKGINCVITQAVLYKGERVSTTRIRKALSEGQVDMANDMLGRRYFLRGRVVHGRLVGRNIGFPTINLAVSGELYLPKTGVYHTEIRLDGKIWNCVTNLGAHPTFNDLSVNLETHIIGFNGNLYGRMVEISFIRYIRATIKFTDEQQLIKQINEDIGSIVNE